MSRPPASRPWLSDRGRYEEGQRLYDAFRERWPGWGFVGPSLAWTIYAGDWARFDSLSKRAEAAGWTAQEVTLRLLQLGRAVREKDPDYLALRVAGIEASLAETDASVGLADHGRAPRR